MKIDERFTIVFIFLIFIMSGPFFLHAQGTKQGANSIPEVSEEQLNKNLVNLVFIRRQFPGILLNELCSIKYTDEDNSLFANPDFNDTNWKKLENTSVTNFESDRIYWCRAKFKVHPSLKNQPLALYVFWQSAMEVYLNGRLIYSFGTFNNSQNGQTIQDAFYLPVREVILYPNDSSDIKLLAFRFGNHSKVMESIGKSTLNSPPSAEFTLHRLSIGETIEIARLNNALYYGIFFGTNCIIIVLTMFQVKRRNDNFILLYFGLFTLFNAFLALTHFIDKGVLELSSEVVMAISLLNSLVYPLSTYFLLLVLRQLFDDHNKITPWIYSAICFALIIIDYLLLLYSMDVSNILFMLNLISFAEIIRLSWLSVRNKVYGSWIIVAGALIFILGGPILERFLAALHMDLTRPFWATMIIRITYYLSMPVSLSIFLAVQNTRNTRLLARQRDELDLEVQERTKELRIEKEKSDNLLLNILPAETADELKRTGTTKAKDFDEVTVLFTDFKDFTNITEKLSAEELVNEINYCYSEFDKIISKYGIEKIKTIGDSYMCAGGLPVPNKTNAEETVLASIEIRDFMLIEKQKREAAGKTFFEIRIGCHTGPVIAGIVGIKKFAYDIWGDTVNIASRMETSGEAGKINISGATYELVKDKFKCEYRGKISAKNKGEIDMYFVESVSHSE